VPPVVTTSSTKRTRSPFASSPSYSFFVPWPFASFRTMRYGLPETRLTTAAMGTAPSSTPAIRSAPAAYGDMPSPIARRRSGRVTAFLMST